MLASRARLGLLKTPLAEGKLPDVGEPDRGVTESMGVLGGIGVFVGSAMVEEMSSYTRHSLYSQTL